MIRNHDLTLTDVAKELRQNQTPAEAILWQKLRTKKFLNLKFRRQHPIKYYVVDFCCVALNLVVELDGSVHDQKDQIYLDQDREFNLQQWGYTVIRFRNNDVTHHLDQTLATLTTTIEFLKTRERTLPSPR